MAVGPSTFNWNPADPSSLPDIVVVVSRALGNGSPAVCDELPPLLGGVPSVGQDFGIPPTQEEANAINDLGCRFKNGSGNPVGRGNDEACTSFPDGRYRFVDSRSTIQFCGFISEPIAFQRGDTRVSVWIRDLEGRWSRPAHMIVRITN